jgi:hypothetical protein
MRFRTLMLFMAAALLVAAGAALRSGNAAVPPASAPVRVLTTEPLRLKLTPSPDASEISVALGDALRDRAETERDPTMRRYLEALGRDGDYLARLSEGARDRLETDAGALAYQLLHVDVTSERVAIAAITAELLPSRRYIASSRAHEDGHALINDQIALRCGPPVAREAIEAGTSGRNLAETIMDGLYDIGDVAHGIYHREVNSTRQGFERAAERAVELATERHC